MTLTFQVAGFRKESVAGTVNLNTKQMASAQPYADHVNKTRQNKTQTKSQTIRTKTPQNFTHHFLTVLCNFRKMNDRSSISMLNTPVFPGDMYLADVMSKTS